MIEFDKTTKELQFSMQNKNITSEMSEKITKICDLLFTDSKEFNEEKAFSEILIYIKEHKRILYSQISNIVYANFNQHDSDSDSDRVGTMISNIEKTLSYTDTPKYKAKKATAKKTNEQKNYEDAEKVLIKIWDHVNLAQRQYSDLKQTDEEYKRKFDNSISPIKEDLVKEMNAQLLTMVSIFTALAFLVFGGISSLGSIFSNHELPLLKAIIIGCVWGLFLLNSIFIFLFCVGKMTKLNFKSSENSNANVVQKYPIVWWSDLIILFILAGTLWLYYIRIEGLDLWFLEWCQGSPQFVVWIGFALIFGIFLTLGMILIRCEHKNSK